MSRKRPIKYATGTKRSVIIQACTYAIRDQEALIDAFESGCNYKQPKDEETKEAINDAKKLVCDFKKLRSITRG